MFGSRRVRRSVRLAGRSVHYSEFSNNHRPFKKRIPEPPPSRRKRSLSEMKQSETGWQKSLSDFAKSVAEPSASTSLSSTPRHSEWNPRISDVRFKVECPLSGDSCEISSVKSLLAIHSDVFAAMFFGTGDFQEAGGGGIDEDSSSVHITDCSKQALDAINAYVFHCVDSVVFTPENIGEILYAASKYCVEGLKNACEQYIIQITDRRKPNALVTVLHSLDKWQMKTVGKTPLENICAKRKGFKAIAKCKLTPKLMPIWGMQQLLAANLLNTYQSHERMFRVAVKWAAQRPAQSAADMDASTEGEHDALGKALASLGNIMGFKKMSAKFFSDEVCAIKGLLSNDQKLEILRFLVSGTK